MALRLEHVKVRAGGSDEYGMLVFVDGKLVAVLVRLDDPEHDVPVGSWFLEAGFGSLAGHFDIFPSLEAAEGWISEQLGAAPRV